MKNIDDILRERLYDTEVAPPPFVWPNVERELHRRRRRAFFWWSFGGLLLAAGIWQFGIRSEQSAVRQSGQPATDLAQQRPDVRSEERDVRPSPVPSIGKSQEQAMNREEQDVRREGLRPNFLDKKSTANISRSAKTGVVEATGKSDDQQVETRLVRASGGEAALPPSDVRSPSSAEAAAGPAADDEVAEIPTTATPTPTSAFPLHPPGLLTSAIPLTGYSLLAAKLPVTDRPFPHARANTRKKSSKYKNCYDFNSHPNVFLVDVYAGPSLVRKDLRPASPEESWYRQRRLATESSDWAFHAGVRGTLLLNQHFLIRTGLHYDQIVEKFEYADPNYRDKNIVERWDPVSGTWQTVWDGTWTYGEHYTKTYNRFGMLDIPLQVGLEVRNRRSGVSLQAGASVNVLFWKRGSILSVMEQPASFSPDGGEIEVFRPRTGLSVSGSVQWFYHLRPRLRVFAEPYFRQVLRPITIDAHPVEQRYGIGGVRLGLTKILN